MSAVYTLIARINDITAEMSELQREKRRLVTRLMASRRVEMATTDAQTDRTVDPKAVYTTDVIRTRRA